MHTVHRQLLPFKSYSCAYSRWFFKVEKTNIITWRCWFIMIAADFLLSLFLSCSSLCSQSVIFINKAVAMDCSILHNNHKRLCLIAKSRPYVGPVVKCCEDKLNISVYWLSRSMKWSVLRPESPLQPWAVIDSCQPLRCRPPFPGVTPLEGRSLWKSATSAPSSRKNWSNIS